MTTYADRSRYLAGHICEWKRLLGYHAFGGGLSREGIVAPLGTGLAIHSGLEAVLKAWQDPAAHSNQPKFDYPNIIGPAVDDYRERIRQHGLMNMNDQQVQEQLAIAEALPHAYARVCEEWFTDEFEILDVEAEEMFAVGSVNWMARSDFVTKSKKTGLFAVHDFKSAAGWYPDSATAEYTDSLQLMLNAEAASRRLGQPVTQYYIHILVKGTKRSQSPLIMPWYQAANPPFQIEDFATRFKYVGNDGKNHYLPKSYTRTNIWDHMEISKWVGELCPLDTLKESIIVIGPYGVHQPKINKFLRGLERNEQRWSARMDHLQDTWSGGVGSTSSDLAAEWTHWAEPAFQSDLDHMFPRTYNCHQYGSACEFYSLCHEKPGWEHPIENKAFTYRIPHHPTEVKK